MKDLKNIFIGKTPVNFNHDDIVGSEVVINGENFYKISNVDSMRPFFMSIVSPYNHWLFISSNGALSAGRKDNDNALFPYYTDDKITESHDITGSKSIFHITNGDSSSLWEPFKVSTLSPYKITRNLYKNLRGTKILFEEINHDLGLEYSYQWNISDKFGFVRKSLLKNNNSSILDIRILDGIQNLLPWGVEFYTQNSTSNLVDAYKRSELLKNSGLGMFAMSAILVDKAEPSEALKTNIAWSIGLASSKKLLSSTQIERFIRTGNVTEELDVKAEKGAYLLNADITLDANSSESWLMAADVNKDASYVMHIDGEINKNNSLLNEIEKDIQLASDELYKLTGASDGLQTTADKRRNIRHFSNTLFNIMRGGIFDKDYTIEKDDFLSYLSNANKDVFKNSKNELEILGNTFSLLDLRNAIESSEDSDFKRLGGEYLPLKFSRRHGDPSRPWNQFSINTTNDDGTKILDYEGNWRDIFQNWEALAYSYPQFIDNMILKFLNASTFDGYNPYRVTKDGFDWETIEPDNPWSYIGYWGDHQIIYLLKFLEFAEDYYPEKLEGYFSKDIFVYANVPYEIKPYKDMLEDPKNTINFNHKTEDAVIKARSSKGSDGALLKDSNNNIVKINFIEKILATVISKISNFIPGAGVWMNTQRPEWNDANNALVGNGVSMVTLYYLRRFLTFFNGLLNKSELKSVAVSEELSESFKDIYNIFNSNKEILSSSNVGDCERKIIMDCLGETSSKYRSKIYKDSFSGIKKPILIKDIEAFISIALEYLEHTIDENKRPDGLYHAYNLINIDSEKISISHLSEMLEGQVGILSSKYLSTKESLQVLDSLKDSKLFRDNQYSYLLYPNKELPGFLEKNVIPQNLVESSKLFQALVQDGNTQIIKRDCRGLFHFNGNFNNANSLKKELRDLSTIYSELIKEEEDLVLNIFEEVFDHKSFTGRSGTFYGYEGLGSIYWHMVSKLLLAVFEVTRDSIKDGSSQDTIGRLFDHYFEINEGIGVNKSPNLYGAFPTDPYSHTPFGKGVQQPGMTGQVKEDILSRFGEMGVLVKDGKIKFHPTIMRKEEFLQESRIFKYVDLEQNIISLDLEKDMLGLTICQVPVIYHSSDNEAIEVLFANGTSQNIVGHEVDESISQSIFNRDKKIIKLNVYIQANKE
jgi:hypothetical protein